MAGAPPNGWIPPQPSSVQPAGLVWLDHGASATWRAMSQPGQYAKPVAAGALPNGCRPPQPSSTYPPRPSGNRASPRAMFQLGQYAEAQKTGEAPSLWSPQTAPLSGMGALDDQAHLYTLDGWGGLHNDG